MRRVGLICLIVSSLISCASPYASNGEHLYLQSHNGRGLIIPQPLVDSNLSHFYDLPPENHHAEIAITPPEV